MADRCSASIVIGGTLAGHHIPDLLAVIADEDARPEFDGAAFTSAELVSGQTLILCAHEVAWGTFRLLEAFCQEHGLAYSRWSDVCIGVWGAERSVYRGNQTGEGQGVIDDYDVSADNQILLNETTARALGSYAAILTYFTSANFAVPPLILSPAVPAPSPSTAFQG
jgi:hypothetical protein